jgi:hypothetical protein
MCYSFSYGVFCNVFILPPLTFNVRLPGPWGLFCSKKKKILPVADRDFQAEIDLTQAAGGSQTQARAG